MSFENWNSRNVTENTTTTTKKESVFNCARDLNVCPSAMASLPCLNCMSENATVKRISLLSDKTSIAQRWKQLGGQLQFNCLPNVCGDLESILHMKYQVAMFEEFRICFFFYIL